MRVRARTSRRRRGAWVLTFALGFAPFVVAHDAQGQTIPATLTGQQFAAADFFPGLGDVALSGECNPSGTSTVEYTATGVASGPYSGTFTESGRATIGPQTIAPGEGTPAGAILTFEATFTVDSASGQVTGRKFIVDPSWRGGNCTNPSPPDGGTFRIFVPQESGVARYEAVISTPEGTFADRGSARVAVLGQPAEPNRDSFEEVFVSDLLTPEPVTVVVPPPSKDACKKGGWQRYTDDQGRPFKNQGDCVSYVSTGGKNKAAG